MATLFKEKIFNRLEINAIDATYSVRFFEEEKVLDSGRVRKTGFIRVLFEPVESKITFKEDGQRQRMYMLQKGKAVKLYEDLKARPSMQYWFALDMASLAQRKSRK